MCDWMKQGTFDTLTGSQSNDRTLSKCLYDSLPVCQIIKQLAIRCCLLLSLAIPYLCAFSVPAVCYLGIAFYCIAVNVLCCLCEDFCFLVLLCLVLCLVILLYYSDCIIVFLTIWIFLCGNTASPADGKPSVRASGNRLCEFTHVMFCPSHKPLASRYHVRHQCL